MANTFTNTPFNDSALMNSATFTDFYDRLKLLALSMFEWKGLPEDVSIRFLEETLFHFGKAVFIKDPSLGFLALRATTSGQLNHYNEPIRINAIGTTYFKQFDIDKCVLIRNNYLAKPTAETIRLYAMRLYEVERSLDTNIKGQKFPILIKGTQQQKLTLENIYRKYDGNQPVIFIDKSIDPEAFKVLNTDVPFVADKMMLYKHDIWNEAMSFLGISNANTDKKERLITAEAESNDVLIQLAAETMLTTRRDACKAINKMFGLDVSVSQKQFQQAPIDYDPAGEIEEGGTE